MRILFLIPTLGQGGAEKVLVNLVNSMDQSRFDITLIALFGGGINQQFLSPHIRFRTIFPWTFPGASHLLKLFSPEFLYKQLIPEDFEIVVAFLEGQAARILSGCHNAKKVCWIHGTISGSRAAASLFRSWAEARKAYGSFDRVVCVSKDVRQCFMDLFHLEEKGLVLYNPSLPKHICRLAAEPVAPGLFSCREFKLCAMGSLIPVKGFDRLLRIHAQLRRDGFPVHTYILGQGPSRKKLEKLAARLGCSASVTFLGYQENPYRYLKNCDLFVCSSHSEGFSTAATEALILGIPVCTTAVSGMAELLGSRSDYGLITANDESSLYCGIKRMLSSEDLLAHYRCQARLRGADFSAEAAVMAVEEFLLNLWE